MSSVQITLRQSIYDALVARKLYPKESFSDIIERLLEETDKYETIRY